jgi:hypothetical protein
MNKPHRHAECIKAWADGAQIQVYLNSAGGWTDDTEPDWYPDYRYRIKPVVTKKYYTYFDERYIADDLNNMQPQTWYSNNEGMRGEHLEWVFVNNKLTAVNIIE